MNKILTFVTPSARFFIGTGVALAMALAISVPHADAATTNILVNENLTLGSTGQNVVVLQGLLSELGYMSISPSIPLGYFGTLTRNALVRYQTAVGVSPADGYFGPATKAAMRADFASHGWLTTLGW